MRNLITLLLANRRACHTLTDAERQWVARAADLRAVHRMVQDEKARYLATVADESEVVRQRTHATISWVGSIIRRRA
jgi:hypothetical protein